jgi:hypothetical protein
MANSYEAAACARSIQIPFQARGTLTSQQIGDMLYFPEAALRGQVAGRRCLSGPGAV